MPGDLGDGPLVATDATAGAGATMAPGHVARPAGLVDFRVPDTPVAEVGEEAEAGEGEEAGEEDEDEDGGCFVHLWGGGKGGGVESWYHQDRYFGYKKNVGRRDGRGN